MAAKEITQEKTGLGNYFVANYPPFSFWKPEHLADGHAVLNRPPEPWIKEVVVQFKPAKPQLSALPLVKEA